nr:MAG TPA: Protein of unknown function (DUF2800) [Caudoviricetes sp.]
MQWNRHSELNGSHAILSASKYYWVNYDENKIADYYRRQLASIRGTELHAFAADCVRLKQKLPRMRKTLNLYVNDAIGYKMSPEVLLYYSPNCFGTADAISFRQDMLRIHDLKTGETPAHMEQLIIYAALFCLEYRIKPGVIQIETRIYQNDEVLVHNPGADEILPVMDKIISFDKVLEQVRAEES